MSKTSVLNNIGPVPILRKSLTTLASCRFSLGKRTVNILSKKRSRAIRAGLNLAVITLMVCVVFTLIAGGLNGRAETQEWDTTDDGPHLVLQITTDTNEPFSGVWALDLSKSKFPSQF